MAAPVTIRTTEAELDLLVKMSGHPFRNYGMTYEGVNAKRQFVRYNCKIATGWRMKPARQWAEIADKYYGVKRLWYGSLVHEMEFVAAALLEGVPTSIEGRIFKLSCRFPAKILRAIKRGEFQAPQLEPELAG